jgi:putative ABC transport system substrate-binding protein
VARLATTTPATVAVRHITVTAPIIGVSLNDPVGMGFAASEARPGGNVTGILVRVEGQSAKQLEIALDAIPGVSKIGILFNPGNQSNLRQRRENRSSSAIGRGPSSC